MRREPRFNLRRFLRGTRGLGLGLLLAALLALARRDSGRTSGHVLRTESRREVQPSPTATPQRIESKNEHPTLTQRMAIFRKRGYPVILRVLGRWS